MRNKLTNLLALAAVGCMCLFGLAACSKATVTSKTSLGKITDADVIPTSFNESMKTRIKTEKAVVIVRGIVSVELGKEAWSIEWSNGRRTIEWEGSRYAYRY
jgi:hypothetical protein